MNDLDLDLLQCEVNAQLMTLLQGPSLRPPKLRKSAEEASRRLNVQAGGSGFDKTTFFATQTRDNSGKAWKDVVHRALSEKRASGVLPPTHSDDIGIFAFFSSERSDEENSDQDDSRDSDPSQNCHTHVIRSGRQQRRMAKVRSLKDDQQKALDFDTSSSNHASDWSSSARSFSDPTCHSRVAAPTTVAYDPTSEPPTDEIAPTTDANQQSSSSESHVRSACVGEAVQIVVRPTDPSFEI